MHARCECKTNPKFLIYGGANPPVKVCLRWSDRNGFEKFKADLGERLPGTTLGRAGDVGNYEPGRVSWQTPSEQAAERRKKFLLKSAINNPG